MNFSSLLWVELCRYAVIRLYATLSLVCAIFGCTNNMHVGLGIFSHMHNVKSRKVVEGT